MGSNPTVTTKKKRTPQSGVLFFLDRMSGGFEVYARGVNPAVLVSFAAKGFFLDKNGDFVIIGLFPEGVASAFRRAASQHTG